MEGDPITEVQFVHITYGFVAGTGQFQEEFRSWCANLDPEKTWTQFQEHFIEAQADLHEQQ